MQKLTSYFLLMFATAALIATAYGDEINLAASMFTRSDAEEVESGEVEPVSYNAQPDTEGAGTRMSRCGYVWKKKSRQVAHVDLLIRQWKTPELARVQFEGMKQIYRGADVSGVGDRAFRSASPAQLHILKGRTWIAVSAGTFKPEPAMEDKVAAVALRRLPE